MKQPSSLYRRAMLAALLLAAPVYAQTRGADVKGQDVVGGNVQGGTVTGGSVTGGTVTGGSVSGGTVTPGTVTPGTVTANADGREIRVRSAGSTSVNVNGGAAEVKLDKQTLLIEKTRVVLDGKEIGALPPTAKDVLVEVNEGLLTVKSGGKQVAKSPLR
jgi:hypothetical protein